MPAKISVKYLKPVQTLIIKNEGDEHGLFYSTTDSLIISIKNLSTLLRFLLANNFISPALLHGLLEEYNTYKGDLDVK